MEGGKPWRREVHLPKIWFQGRRIDCTCSLSYFPILQTKLSTILYSIFYLRHQCLDSQVPNHEMKQTLNLYSAKFGSIPSFTIYQLNDVDMEMSCTVLQGKPCFPAARSTVIRQPSASNFRKPPQATIWLKTYNIFHFTLR